MMFAIHVHYLYLRLCYYLSTIKQIFTTSLKVNVTFKGQSKCLSK